MAGRQLLGPLVRRFVLPFPGLTRMAQRAKRRASYERGRFQLDRPEFEPWCAWLDSKVRLGNFEIAPHGLYHFSPTARFSSLEFESFEYNECLKRLKEAERIFGNSGISHVKGFRPLGWGQRTT